MKKILSEDTVSATANSRSWDKAPSAGVYVPNYKMVNQVIMEAGNSGRISFMGALAKMGQQKMAQQQAVYDRVEVSEALGRIDKGYRESAEGFLKENPSAQGYMDYITGTYSQLASQEFAGASNANVKAQLQQTCAARHSDIANHAFQIENETYAAYTIDKVNQAKAETLNSLVNNPDEVASYTVEFNQKVSTLQGVLPENEFQKFARNSQYELFYAYGQGLIRKNPYTALSIIQSDTFSKNLDSNIYRKLVKSAETEIKHQEYLSLRREYQQNKQMAGERNKIFLSAKVAIAQGDFSPNDLETIYGDLDEKQKHELQEKYEAHKKKKAKESQVFNAIQQGIDNHELVNATPKQLDKFFQDWVEGQNERNKAADKDVMSVSEKAVFARENQRVFITPINSLKNEIADNLKWSNNIRDIVDSALALSTCKNIPALKGVSPELKDFADYIMSCGSGRIPNLPFEELRNVFLKPVDEDTRKRNWRAVLGGDNSVKRRDALLKEFWKQSGFSESGFLGFGKSGVPKTSNALLLNNYVMPIIERVAQNTGDKQRAFTIANQALKGVLVENPEHQFELEVNPLTPDNVGMTRSALDNAKTVVINKALRGYGLADKEKIKRAGIHFEATSPVQPVYRMYYLQDPQNLESKEYLMNKNGGFIVWNVEKYKAPKKEQKEQVDKQ